LIQGEESDTKCHPERSEGSHKFLRYAQDKLHGIYPEPKTETLPPYLIRGQGDTWRRVQNDKHVIPPIVIQPPVGRWGGGEKFIFSKRKTIQYIVEEY